ncbi:MAG TPA: tripartite tricarboxylate transporter substrate-binding protein [Xanthobacteraceae bacterium]|jgi:tripartite-type tricarboxylate transporter receptor subunit TctC
MHKRVGRFFAVPILVAVAGTATLQAEPVSDFYRGKTISIIVGSDAGGGYDLTARALARVIGHHIPGNPQVVVQNKPGASSLLAANYVYDISPHDGTVIAAVQRPVPFQFLFKTPGVHFDLSRLQWLGSSTKEPGVFVAWHTTPFGSVEDLKTKEMVVGGNGPTTDTELFARVMNLFLGTKLKIVSGYPGQVPIVLAMERGEVQGVANWSWSDIETRHPDWIRDKKVRLLMQLSLEKIPALGDVPSLLDLTRTAEEREIVGLLLKMKALGRPYFLAPGVPAERVAALRTAFDATMADKDFLQEAARTLGPIDPISGKEMQRMLASVYSLSPDIVEKARAAVNADAAR